MCIYFNTINRMHPLSTNHWNKVFRVYDHFNYSNNDMHKLSPFKYDVHYIFHLYNNDNNEYIK